MELPPETPKVTEEEYFNKNLQNSINFGVTFDLNQNDVFIRDLKDALHETDLSKRDIKVRNEIEKLDDNSKDLTIYFKVDPISKRDERYDYKTRALVKSENSKNAESKDSLESKAVRLDRVSIILIIIFWDFLRIILLNIPIFCIQLLQNVTNQ